MGVVVFGRVGIGRRPGVRIETGLSRERIVPAWHSFLASNETTGRDQTPDSGPGRGGEVAFGATGLTAVLLWLAGPRYWVGMEARTGATPGKRALHLRVVSVDGGSITVGQAVVRSLLLLVDTFLVGLVGLIVATSSDRRQRVGDRVAKTVVVRV